jgi:hypothetical protein
MQKDLNIAKTNPEVKQSISDFNQNIPLTKQIPSTNARHTETNPAYPQHLLRQLTRYLTSVITRGFARISNISKDAPNQTKPEIIIITSQSICFYC